MQNKWFGGALIVLAAMAATPAQAELVGAGSPSTIQQIMESQGLSVERMSAKDSADYLESKHDGLKFLVLFMNCDDEKRNCKTLQFYMGFNDAKDTSLETINNWNKNKRFARAYRDDEGDPVLEMDLDLDFKGIPRENVGEAINTWKALMASFQDHIHD
jgi:hypothetical protein